VLLGDPGQRNQKVGEDPLEEYYSRLLGEMGGTASGAMLQSDINRDVLPGNKSPWAEELEPEQLSRIDRYAWGAQAGLGGIPTAIYSELVKIPAIQEPMKYVTRGLGALTGYDEAEEWYNTDETSSPPNLGNLGAYVRGAIRGR
jgi:hypothetical protein